MSDKESAFNNAFEKYKLLANYQNQETYEYKLNCQFSPESFYASLLDQMRDFLDARAECMTFGDQSLNNKVDETT